MSAEPSDDRILPAISLAVAVIPQCGPVAEKLYVVLQSLSNMKEAFEQRLWSRSTGLFRLPLQAGTYELANLQVEFEGRQQLNRDWLQEVDDALTQCAEQLTLEEVVLCVGLLAHIDAAVLSVPFCKRFNALLQDQSDEAKLATMATLLATA